MVHLLLHFALPVVLALTFYRTHWRLASVVMIATMLVDVDHLLSRPIYDPARCSIGFHPLHTAPAIGLYAVLFLLPVLSSRNPTAPGVRLRWLIPHLVGLGLIVHMALDWTDCVSQ